jgi:cardiolipin synthase A/B
MSKHAARVALGAGAVIVLLLLASFFHRVLDNTRGTPLRVLRDGMPADTLSTIGDRHFADVAAVLAGVPLVAGNTVTVLASADDSYASLFADLRAARLSITLQPYYCLPGRVADSTAVILVERARAGVRVFMLADGYGCRRFVARYGPALRETGVELAVLRPVRWHTLHKAQHRSHVRIAVIDGAVAYAGGFGIDDKWLYGTASSAAWRDTNVRFTGPAVRQAQGAFVVAWTEATRELIAGDELFPRDQAATSGGGVTAGVQFAGPGLGTSAFERLLFLTIGGARERLYITNAYFLPNRAQRQLLAQAARRGVDVRVLTAGDRTDVRSTRLASRASYDELLQTGVRIYEYQPAMIHAKTFVVDGVWAAVGSMNFDNRSMRLGDELNVVMHDRELGRTLDSIFADDLAHAVEIRLAEHRARPRLHRLLDRSARLIEPLM